MAKGKTIPSVAALTEVTEETAGVVVAGSEGLPPSRTSPEWSDYVMSYFQANELDPGGAPTIVGLRRVADLILGETIYCVSEVVNTPCLGSNGELTQMAVVECEIHIEGRDRIKRCFREVADVNNLNTEPEYRRFPTATCATRAEARCYRKALRIRPVAAEEMCSIPISLPDADAKIDDGRQATIISLCSRLNINTQRFINSGKGRWASLQEVPNSTAIAMIDTLNGYRRNPNSIPADLKGFSNGN